MSLAPQRTRARGPAPAGPGTRAREGRTRPKLKLWDRIKFLLLFAVVWLMLVWAAMAGEPDPAVRGRDAAAGAVESGSWLLVLAGPGGAAADPLPHQRALGGLPPVLDPLGLRRVRAVRPSPRFSDWTRFRLARAFKWFFWIALFAVIAGAVLDTSPVLALFQAPAIIWQLMPLLLQVRHVLSIVVLQFVAIFWFLSRGGVDVYYPDDIKTRFTDVWGQDHVLARVKENIVFLERPEEIEAKGGYVPAACCCGVRPAPARRSWPRRWPARPAGRTSSSTPARSPTCSWASASSRSSRCSASCASSRCATAA